MKRNDNHKYLKQELGADDPMPLLQELLREQWRMYRGWKAGRVRRDTAKTAIAMLSEMVGTCRVAVMDERMDRIESLFARVIEGEAVTDVPALPQHAGD